METMAEANPKTAYRKLYRRFRPPEDKYWRIIREEGDYQVLILGPEENWNNPPWYSSGYLDKIEKYTLWIREGPYMAGTCKIRKAQFTRFLRWSDNGGFTIHPIEQAPPALRDIRDGWHLSNFRIDDYYQGRGLSRLFLECIYQYLDTDLEHIGMDYSDFSLPIEEATEAMGWVKRFWPRGLLVPD